MKVLLKLKGKRENNWELSMTFPTALLHRLAPPHERPITKDRNYYRGFIDGWAASLGSLRGPLVDAIRQLPTASFRGAMEIPVVERKATEAHSSAPPP